MEKFKRISWLSLTIGWIALIITHIVWSNIEYNNASGGDTGVVIFWASFFLLIFYLLFVLLPRKRIVYLAENLNLVTFVVLFAIYSLISFIVLIGWIFLKSNFAGVFIDAFVFGLFFGFTFHFVWSRHRELVKQKHSLLFLFLPFVFLLFYLYIFPRVLPSYAFKAVPQFVRYEIIKRTIPHFKVGDSMYDLEKALPGEFKFEECEGSGGALYEDFQYVVVVKCCKIARLEYGPRNSSGITIEPLESVPCN